MESDEFILIYAMLERNRKRQNEMYYQTQLADGMSEEDAKKGLDAISDKVNTNAARFNAIERKVLKRHGINFQNI